VLACGHRLDLSDLWLRLEVCRVRPLPVGLVLGSPQRVANMGSRLVGWVDSCRIYAAAQARAFAARRAEKWLSSRLGL
jgi:hypothetical protein